MPAGSRGFEMKRPTTLVAVVLAAVLAGGAVRVVQDQCGPFTDVTPGFCPFVLELYYLGITAGTSATTFSPDDPLTRGQGAVFIAKGLNQSLARSSRRAALGQWWTTQTADTLQIIPIGVPDFVQSDGTDVWISSNRNNSVTRVRSSDGRIVETWTGIGNAFALLPAMGRIFVSGYSTPGSVYAIDPATRPAPSRRSSRTSDRSRQVWRSMDRACGSRGRMAWPFSRPDRQPPGASSPSPPDSLFPEPFCSTEPICG